MGWEKGREGRGEGRKGNERKEREGVRKKRGEGREKKERKGGSEGGRE